jgi:acyl dehydratase
MTSHSERALLAWNKRVGSEEGVGDWHTIDQRQINAFADATLDHQFIHVDPELAAKRSPYKVTIAHGFLTLSMVPHLTTSALPVQPDLTEGVLAAINYGLDRVRFPSPVKVGSRVRARSELLSVEAVSADTLQIKRKITIEVEGSDKPGCVAETLARLIFS